MVCSAARSTASSSWAFVLTAGLAGACSPVPGNAESGEADSENTASATNGESDAPTSTDEGLESSADGVDAATESTTSEASSDASDSAIIDDFPPATDTAESTDTPSCSGEKVVHFVYFVEADQAYSALQRDDIEAMAFAFQQYFHEQLGVTFYLNDPVVDVIMADHDAEWYVTTPDGIHSDDRWYRLGNIKTEVYAKLGIEDFDPDHRVVNYPIARYDGRVGGNFGGAWMDGDDLSCMAEAGLPTYPYDKAGPAHCMGHPAHEFGHVLGLDHTGPNEDCMQFGFYNNTGGAGMCNFFEDNVAQVLADPINTGWFEALPGEICEGI